ncbi:hypothetical protein A2971_03875 [Candidatus Gottesmanbacteria bacterium RIFCSPLOWO2_01_FULL_46_21]|uniref:UDP-N-acetylmuramoyl-tripeptide-D-alanyl-D-alanine ligase n=2 Tax=Candidatus Gottesmaniibacteriota TaxID=1752720 RepID=A0A0G1TFH0_9BACT|nr:MAG: UDP-N-acetylmuramoyl-tripeptide-D-alanyl-D-alanine ligase [Candidatus Gottesmanbacteria bacterium GW2011_GWA1_47_8]OGG29275.1 MAG: hypothetical protein A2971_03875 [Candidatus Gottesmanbacteria bacterium RIFCSPLOWO2_01_FULL_46_21]
MIFLITVLGVAWIFRIIHNIVAFIQLWWVKEWRFDRMRIHLRTDQGKKLYFLPYRGLKISPKTILFCIMTFISELLIYFALPFHPLWRLFILDLLSFPLIGLFVFIVSIPQYFYHQWIIGKATEKIRAHKNLFVIGITGSYGKTSTKEYLATILSSKFNALKTEKSQNSLIGIAEVILRKLQSEHEIFVVEMGAYKRGEIAEMVRMVRPQIGIITAINEQHQDLFGTIENTMKAKYELLAGLTGKRIAVMNNDNAYVKTMIGWAKKDKLDVREVQITSIVQKPEGISFRLNSIRVYAPVVGIHQAHNISLAITTAVAAGMSLADAAKTVEKITPIDRMMKPIEGINGSTFIDDTFNNNPDAAMAALDYLATTKGKKILVFQPMIELGAYAQSVHARVGKRAAEVCDAIILTNKNYLKFFPGNVYEPKEASEYIRKIVVSGDTVLFKGKEALKILNELV